jgi:hypothetical protein
MDSSTENAKASSNGVRYALSASVFKRNCLLAVIVGCLLSITNQLDVLLSQPFSLPLGGKILFNFLIPFVVSSVSTAVNRRGNI